MQEDVTTVALANKHKTSSAVRRYIPPTDELKVQPALKVARRLAEDELLEDVELKGGCLSPILDFELFYWSLDHFLTVSYFTYNNGLVGKT